MEIILKFGCDRTMSTKWVKSLHWFKPDKQDGSGLDSVLLSVVTIWYYGDYFGNDFRLVYAEVKPLIDIPWISRLLQRLLGSS